MASNRQLALVLTLFGVSVEAPALADGPQIALFAPWVAPPEAVDRHRLITGLTEAASKALGSRADGETYLKYKDFAKSMSAKPLDLALIDTALALESRGKWRILATWSSEKSWAVVGADNARPLQHKRLALQSEDAPGTWRFVSEVLFRGLVTDRRFFSKIVSVPTPRDARKAVSLGQADVAILAVSDESSLEEIVRLDPWPELALVTSSTGPLPNEAELKKLIESYWTTQMGGRWSDGAPNLPKPFALDRPHLAPPHRFVTSVRELFATPRFAPPPLDLRAAWAPRSARAWEASSK